MMLERDLAVDLLRLHPTEAARLLERMPADDGARFLESIEARATAACLRVMHHFAAAELLAALDVARAAEIVSGIPPDIAAAQLRRLSEEKREALLGRLAARRARALRSVLGFPPNTAGSLMDPHVLALAEDLHVSEAVQRVRDAAHEARYNIYTLDPEQHLVGVFNLRELLLASPRALLSSIARRNPHRLPSMADRQAILAHPGWREVHALPVVDRAGLYLGAIRYRTLRRLEEELGATRAEAGATARALGDLFRTGASSLLEAVAASASADPRRPGNAA